MPFSSEIQETIFSDSENSNRPIVTSAAVESRDEGLQSVVHTYESSLDVVIIQKSMMGRKRSCHLSILCWAEHTDMPLIAEHNLTSGNVVGAVLIHNFYTAIVYCIL